MARDPSPIPAPADSTRAHRPVRHPRRAWLDPAPGQRAHGIEVTGTLTPIALGWNCVSSRIPVIEKLRWLAARPDGPRAIAKLSRRPQNDYGRWQGDAITVISAMAIRHTWSGRRAVIPALVLCLILQALTAGLHAAHFVDQRLIAEDPTICHGGNGTPTLPRSDADTCCLLGCNSAGQSATLFAPIALMTAQIYCTTHRLLINPVVLLRTHLADRAHSRPRSPPSA